jgi:hypothetical protein
MMSRGVSFVVQSTKQVVWLLAACATLAAQVAPAAFSRPCDRPCCASEARGCHPAADDSQARPAGGCPLCAATAATCPTNTAEQPCRCHLNARQDQPVSSPRGTTPRLDRADQNAVAVTDHSDAPLALGVSREYVATSLSVPIRPVRILCGVWRN